MAKDYLGKIVDSNSNTFAIASTLYGVCDTASTEAAKVVTCDSFTGLLEGVTIKVKFTYTNTASGSITVNVNNTGAKPLYRYGTTYPGTKDTESWYANSIVSMTYNGTAWYIDSFKNDTNDNTWQANALNKAGYVAAPTSSNASNVWATTTTGSPYWKAEHLLTLATSESLYTSINNAGWVSDVIE